MVGTAQSEPGVDETGTVDVTMGNGLCLQSGIWIDTYFCFVFQLHFRHCFYVFWDF